MREEQHPHDSIPYFVQQRKDKTMGLVPALKQICSCEREFNPDKLIDNMRSSGIFFEQAYVSEMIDCQKCKHIHHISCLTQAYSHLCANCRFDMSGQLAQGIRERKREKKSVEKKQILEEEKTRS